MPTLNYGTRQGSPGFVGPPRPSSGFQFGGGVSTNTADTYSQQEVDVKGRSNFFVVYLSAFRTALTKKKKET